MDLVKFKGFTFVEGGICAPHGFRAAGIHCGVRKNKEKRDLALIAAEHSCAAAAMYTRNKVKGAPIAVTKKHLTNGTARAVIVNSGNANTCNADGVEKANQMCKATAAALKIPEDEVIVASTGVIGEPLPIEPIVKGIPTLAKALSAEGSGQAAEAIMTTDTVKKELALSFSLDGVNCTVAGIAKGSGMIHPNMATMLCFLTTDVNISAVLLKKALTQVVDETFHMVSVDGDTSTNDMVSCMASGDADKKPITSAEDPRYAVFVNALYILLMNLSRAIAADGEGATKLLECTVTDAPDRATARRVAKSVITSSLFKAAMFGADANWGRILCAIGYTEGSFSIDKVAVTLKSEKGTLPVCQNGSGVPFQEAKAKRILEADEIKILISLGGGDCSAIAWGCDLTYDYVKINGDYRT